MPRHKKEDDSEHHVYFRSSGRNGSMTETQLLISYVTLAIASVGAVLGIMNTWRSFDRDRIRLKVLPHWAIPSAVNPRFCIKVVNLSYIPVTVTFVYFKMRTENRNYVFPPSPPGETLPARMEPTLFNHDIHARGSRARSDAGGLEVCACGNRLR